jgi:hypothetical protein
MGSTFTDPTAITPRRFRVKTIPHRHHAAGKRKIRRRLDKPVTAPSPDPVFTATNLHSEVAAKTQAVACGGIGAMQLRVRKVGLAEAIDQRLHLLKFHSCQLVRGGRRLVYRLLSWNEWQGVFLRVVPALRC